MNPIRPIKSLTVTVVSQDAKKKKLKLITNWAKADSPKQPELLATFRKTRKKLKKAKYSRNLKQFILDNGLNFAIFKPIEQYIRKEHSESRHALETLFREFIA